MLRSDCNSDWKINIFLCNKIISLFFFAILNSMNIRLYRLIEICLKILAFTTNFWHLKKLFLIRLMQVCLDLEEKCFYRLSNTGYASPNELIGVQLLFSHFGISKSFLLWYKLNSYFHAWIYLKVHKIVRIENKKIMFSFFIYFQ